MGCRRRAPQHELVRIVRRVEGSLEVGRTLEGRGAWLCAGSTACLTAAARRNAFARAFRAPVSQAAIDRLELAFVPESPVRETGTPVTTGRDDEGAG
ncbi:DUF448 domain-containing protein [Actinomarinicola tropica]|uniref:DUF448 domain-containing protein n=1 Tax=Actinomarinicola tropica TaxID=2789776 RepID=UPI003898DCBC